jgi:leucyl-tRNA synthetase
MFPYPSGSGLHVGHPLGYIASDIFARFKRMEGFNVLHPMGYDAFGLPAEQYAIQTGIHPAVSTAHNIERYRAQLDNLGFSYDWDREVRTCEPSYYRWTQWIFLRLFDHYYDRSADTARPVSELAAHLERFGTDGLQASCSETLSLSADAWQALSSREKDEVLMNYRLAYRKSTFVWWCEELGTVLANDEVKDGLSERGGFPVERKPMLQWSLRITAYAERLLRDLEQVDFSDAMKKTQANWIGKSVGAQLFFPLEGHDYSLEIFTTRPDTIFGATFMVLAPEHDLVPLITTPDQREAVGQYLRYVKSRSERDRMSETKEVSGAFTGCYALNPFNQERIPVWIAEYVLKDYGTGAIMAVPADDERDLRFARHFSLPVVQIIDKSGHPGATIEDKVGTMIGSDFLDGMEVPDAIEAVIRAVEQKGIGSRKVNYKLRDAIYSRQRYWGEPFPILYDQDGVAHPLPDEELPLELPELDDFKPAAGAKSPLARATEWVELPDGYRRETDTMPGFAGSSWYFLRYMDAHNDQALAGQEALTYWRDVDLYVGGTEHAVGHLMYSRFWHKFLYDIGVVPTVEPYRKLINQGMIQGVIESLYLRKEKAAGKTRFLCANIAKGMPESDFIRIPVLIDYVVNYGSPDSHLDAEAILQFVTWRPNYADAEFEDAQGRVWSPTMPETDRPEDFRLVTHTEVGKMSKSKFNVINPDDVVERYGADCFRMYEMFLGPIEQAKPWDTKGIDGVSKFLRKFWNLFFDENGRFLVNELEPDKEEWRILHTAIRKVREDIERFSFNTCVSAFMIAVNELRSRNCSKRAILDPLTRLCAPFAPHLAEELWHQLGHTDSVCLAEYPVHEAAYLVQDTIPYPVSINGKKRDLVELPAGLPKEQLEKIALELDSIQKWIQGKQILKVVVVPDRLVNIVVKD